jgi:voltage-gated potassium channel
MKKPLKKFIENIYTEIIICLLITTSVVLTVLEVQAPIGSEIRNTYQFAGMIITLIFIIELSIRWYITKTSGKFFKTYWIDILAVIPAVRALRVFRIFRLLRLVRMGILISNRSKKLTGTLQEGLMENLIIFVILIGVILIGAIGMLVVEQQNRSFSSISKTIWWSLFTLMAGEPIGGEAKSFAGKVISAMVMLGGLSLFAMFTGIVSAVMVSRLRGRMDAKDSELNELKDHYIICGWNRSAHVILKELQAAKATKNTPIVIIAEFEGNPPIPPDINMGFIFLIRDDYTSTEVLLRAGVKRAKVAILLADKCKSRSDQDRDARTILAALTIEKLKPSIFTSAELLRRENSDHLKMAGVEDIVVGDEYMGNLIAHSSRAAGLVSVMDELLTATRGNQFYKIDLPKHLVGITIKKALTLIKVEVNAILISIEITKMKKKSKEDKEKIPTPEIITNPPHSYKFKENDKLILIAPTRPVFSKH